MARKILPKIKLRAPKLLKTTVLMTRFGRVVYERVYELINRKQMNFFGFGSTQRPVIIVFVTKDGKFGIMRQYRYAARDFVTETAGGNIKGVEYNVVQEKGGINITWEQVEKTAREELLEETGYLPGKLVMVGPPAWIDPATLDATFIPILALDCEKVAQTNLEETEIIENYLISKKDLIRMVQNKEINDSKTLAAFFMVLVYLYGEKLIELVD